MGKAEAYLMAAACGEWFVCYQQCSSRWTIGFSVDEHDLNALAMANGILGDFKKSLPQEGWYLFCFNVSASLYSTSQNENGTKNRKTIDQSCRRKSQRKWWSTLLNVLTLCSRARTRMRWNQTWSRHHDNGRPTVNYTGIISSFHTR
jgi:hypothetical protein